MSELKGIKYFFKINALLHYLWLKGIF